MKQSSETDELTKLMYPPGHCDFRIKSRLGELVLHKLNLSLLVVALRLPGGVQTYPYEETLSSDVENVGMIAQTSL